MQSEVIDEILNVEDEAEKIIEDAKSEASELVNSAHDKAAKIISDALESAKERSRTEIAAAEEILQKELSEYEEERARLDESERKIDDDAKDRAVSRVVDCIVKIGE